LDTIGELASVYSLAAVSFVGGSLIPAGGHNPL
jgi:3-deoxy-D-manno-octulosonic-acid transferase